MDAIDIAAKYSQFCLEVEDNEMDNLLPLKSFVSCSKDTEGVIPTNMKWTRLFLVHHQDFAFKKLSLVLDYKVHFGSPNIDAISDCDKNPNEVFCEKSGNDSDKNEV